MKKIKCCVVGLGRISWQLEDDRFREKPCTHVGAIRDNKECLLVAGCDDNLERRQLFQKRFPKIAIYSELSEMLVTEKPTILHIATPPDSHVPLLKVALEHRIPVVVCEKPVSHDLSIAREFESYYATHLQEAESNHFRATKIIVNHERRFALDYLRAKQVIESQLYGKLCSIFAKLYMGKTRKISEILWDDGTHMIDIIRFLTGAPLTLCTAHGDPQTGGANFSMTAQSGEVLVLGDFSGGHDHLVFQLELSFEKGKILIGNGVYDEYESGPSPYYEKMRSLIKTKFHFKKTHYFSGMMNHAVSLAEDPNQSSRSSWEDGLADLLFIQQLSNIKNHE